MSRNMLRACCLASACLFVVGLAKQATAHGFAGARFFPATLATDDPFVAEELSLPTYTWSRDSAQTETSEFSFDFAKRITPNLGLEFGATYLRVRPPGGPTVDGWDNLDLGAKYQLLAIPCMRPFFRLAPVSVSAALDQSVSVRKNLRPSRRGSSLAKALAIFRTA